MTAQTTDYDSVMQASLKRVFGEGRASHRTKTFAELYHADATLRHRATDRSAWVDE
jgi:hypothetical protein